MKNAQYRLLTKLLSDGRSPSDDPFLLVWSLCQRANTPGFRYLSAVLIAGDFIDKDTNLRKERIRSSDKSKAKTYVELNPDLVVHPLYHASVPEHHRIATTRLRLSAHNLAIETGRWSRTPRLQRLCRCGMVQTEEHCLCFCNLTQELRSEAGLKCSSINSFFSDNDTAVVAEYAYKCTKLHES